MRICKHVGTEKYAWRFDMAQNIFEFWNFSCIFLTKTVSISTAYILLLAFENSPFRKEAAYHVLLELNLKRNFPAVYFANKSVLKERFCVLKY